MVGLMPARSRSYSPYSTQEAAAPAAPMRRTMSLPAGFSFRGPVSFTTTTSPIPMGSPKLRRHLPSVRIEVADSEQVALRHGISLIVERSNRRKAQIVTHTLTIDTWLFTLLLGFSLLGTASGYALGGNPTAQSSQHVRTAATSMGFDAVWVPGPVGDLPTMRRGANLAPSTRGVPPEDATSWDIIFPPVDEQELADVIRKPTGHNQHAETSLLREVPAIEIPARWRDVPDADRPAKWRQTVVDDGAGSLEPEVAHSGESLTTPAPRQLHTADELAQLLAAQSDTPTVIFFGAKGCRTCHALQPRLQKIAAQAGATFTYLHYGKPTHEAYVQHEVSKTPTVHVYNGGGLLIDSSVYASKDVARLASVLKGARAQGAANPTV